MKKNIFIFGIIALFMLFACKQASEAKKIVQASKQIAKNAKEMQKEENKKSDEEKNKIFSESLLKDLNLKTTKNMVDVKLFERVKKCADIYSNLSKDEKSKLNLESLKELFKPCGYTNINTMYNEIKEVASYHDFLMGAAMEVYRLKTARLTGGKEGYNKAVKEFAEKLEKKGYTAEDLRNIEKYKKTIGTALEMAVVIKMLMKK